MSSLSIDDSTLFWKYELISPATVERAEHLVEDMLTRAKSSSSATDKHTVRITLNGASLSDAARRDDSVPEDMGTVWSLDSLGFHWPSSELGEDNDPSFDVLNLLAAASICHAFDNPSLCPETTPEVANTEAETATNTTDSSANVVTDPSFHCFVAAMNDLSTRAPYIADVLQRTDKDMSGWGQMERALRGTQLEEVHDLVSKAFRAQIAHTGGIEDNSWESQVERIPSRRKLLRATFLAETQIARLTGQEQKAWEEVTERCEKFWNETEAQSQSETESQGKLKSSEVTATAWREFERLMSEIGVGKEKRIESACKDFVRQITEAEQ